MKEITEADRDAEEIVLFRENSIYDVYKLTQLKFIPDVVFDFGANVGAFTCHARNMFHRSEIIAVEPDPNNFARLEKNIATKLAGMKAVKAMRAGLGSGPLWHCPSGNGGGGEVYVSVGPGYAQGDFTNEAVFESTGIATVTLRELVKSHVSAGQSFMVKMDCEGGELTTLVEDIDVLASADYIAMEIHRYGATHEGKLAADAAIDSAILRLEETHDCHQDGALFYATKRAGEQMPQEISESDLSSIAHRHQLFSWLQRTGRTGKWVEVGVADGGHSSMMLKMSSCQKLYMVDTWSPDDDYGTGNANAWHESCLKIRDEYPDRAVLVHLPSVEASDLFNDGDLDFIFIDADHSYAGISADLAAWYPKVRSGGVLTGHDYVECPAYGVVPAVNEFVAENGLDMVLLPVDSHDNPVWAFVKP